MKTKILYNVKNTDSENNIKIATVKFNNPNNIIIEFGINGLTQLTCKIKKSNSYDLFIPTSLKINNIGILCHNLDDLITINKLMLNGIIDSKNLNHLIKLVSTNLIQSNLNYNSF